MALFIARIGRFSIWSAMRDAHVRTVLYMWLMIAGICVLLANAVASSM